MITESEEDVSKKMAFKKSTRKLHFVFCHCSTAIGAHETVQGAINDTGSKLLNEHVLLLPHLNDVSKVKASAWMSAKGSRACCLDFPRRCLSVKHASQNSPQHSQQQVAGASHHSHVRGAGSLNEGGSEATSSHSSSETPPRVSATGEPHSVKLRMSGVKVVSSCGLP